ncbi:hypothetical protein IT399_03545, partial [Candidatus Nomurabacteria bacterium]|nr:hypothetical protein [Candidatus Nomurabacteria bacterium]
MDENILKTIKNKFDSLPERIKDTIMSSHYEDTLIEIGNFYKLNVEQMGIMEMETTMVMMGLTSPNDFETNLTHELGVDKIKGSEIAQAINEKVFLKIRELLKLMNTPQGEEPSLEESTEENENKILHSSGIEIISENKKETLPAVEKL